MERPKKLSHRLRKKKSASRETIEYGYEDGPDAGKCHELEQIARSERRNEPGPNTERDRQDEDVNPD